MLVSRPCGNYEADYHWQDKNEKSCDWFENDKGGNSGEGEYGVGDESPTIVWIIFAHFKSTPIGCARDFDCVLELPHLTAVGTRPAALIFALV